RQEELMRENVRDRYYRTFTYQDVDRVPDIEFGYWPQTIRRWLSEGMEADLTEEDKNSMFPRKLDDFFGFEHEGRAIRIDMGMKPEFEEEVLDHKGASVVMRGKDGIVAQRYLRDADESSIPHFISFPVEKPDDWERIKERYDLSDPVRRVREDEIGAIRQAQSEGTSIYIFLTGFYGQLRNWMGFENLSYAFYDYPDMIHDMVEHWSELLTRQIDNLPDDIMVDIIHWWEDMACKNGPLVGPAIFREFLQPGYRKVMKAAKKRGCALGIVDCDGDPHDIVANWLEEGVNIMFPLEISAGVDAKAWRDEFGMELRLRGGIAKKPLVEGGKAIDREFERIRPVFEQGGYIPHLDHLVPPDVPYSHYQEYLEKKRKMIGKL
ncbi:uroporphyrinogen decarboxylase family protein, partial [Candidatus Hydrogenedentota bacterium]